MINIDSSDNSGCNITRCKKTRPWQPKYLNFANDDITYQNNFENKYQTYPDPYVTSLEDLFFYKINWTVISKDDGFKRMWIEWYLTCSVQCAIILTSSMKQGE